MAAGAQQRFVVYEKEVGVDEGGGSSVWQEVGRGFVTLRVIYSWKQIQGMQENVVISHQGVVRTPEFKITAGMRLRELSEDVTPAPVPLPDDRVFNVVGMYDREERGIETTLLLMEGTVR